MEFAAKVRARIRTIRNGLRSVGLAAMARPISGLGRRTTILLEDFPTATNPSIVRHASDWVIALRVPAYRIASDGAYRLAPGHDHLTSSTVLVTCDDDLKPVRCEVVRHESARDQPGAANGLEDPRLFSDDTVLFCLWSGLQLPENEAPANPSKFYPDWTNATNTMFFGTIRGNVAVNLTRLPSPHNAPREKNWMPFRHEDECRFIYRLHPLEAYALRRHHEPDELIMTHAQATTRALEGWSGSSQLVRWETDSWLGVSHYAARSLRRVWPWRRAVYLHRFVQFDDCLRVKSMSRPFVFDRHTVEFCAGLATLGDRVILSYGARDRSAHLLELDRVAVRGMLK